jgi:hypothetical protein
MAEDMVAARGLARSVTVPPARPSAVRTANCTMYRRESRVGSSGLPPNPCHAPAERSGQITTGVAPVHASSRETEPNKPERIEPPPRVPTTTIAGCLFLDLCQLVRGVSRRGR